MPTRSRRANAAAARRLRDQLASPASGSSQRLPEELAALIRDFRPTAPLADSWPRLRPVVTAVMTASVVRGTDSFRKHLTHVGYFLLWADQQGLPVSAATVVRKYTDEYTRTGMPGSTAKSRADRRARLRRLADQVNPVQAPDTGVAIPRPSVKPPYTDAELATLVRVALTQPTPEQTRRATLCIGLGAGAGLDSADLRSLRTHHLHDRDAAGITVTVPGRSGRIVPVRKELEHLVRRGLDGTGPGQLLLGRVEDRRNIAGNALADLVVLGDCPHIEQSRLRATWLAALLAQPVRLDVVLQAAGLRSARTLPDLLPHLPPSDPSQAAAALRGTGNPA